jgi:dTDP-glucose pyrophosphorylase
VVEKPRHPRTDLKGCGIYLFDLAFFDAVRRTPRTALRNEYEITDAVQIFIDDGYHVEAAEVVKADVNVSYPADLLALNLSRLDRLGRANWVAPDASVDPAARLQRTVVLSGARIGAGAVLQDCLVFPDSTVPMGRERRSTIFTGDAEIRCEEGHTAE